MQGFESNNQLCSEQKGGINKSIIKGCINDTTRTREQTSRKGRLHHLTGVHILNLTKQDGGQGSRMERGLNPHCDEFTARTMLKLCTFIRKIYSPRTNLQKVRKLNLACIS